MRYRINRTAVVIITLLLVLAGIGASYAQDPNKTPPAQLPPQLQPPHPADKAAQRYDIDAKRMGESMTAESAMPRAREFKRIDSTYYVGWMYEGTYKYEHAADYVGYKNAAVPLDRALTLLEHDYKRALSTRTDNVLTYFPIYKFQVDYTMIAYDLMNCYSNTDQPDKVYKLLRRCLKWNFQRDYYMDAYDYLGWTVHRNRYYTSDKYAFLKNSIDENEKLANRYLDTGMSRIERNKSLNAHIFQPGYDDGDKMAVYHYKNILYSYSINVDSAMHYFGLMRAQGRLPHNNYANFRGICGSFREAEGEYKLASQQDAGDKRLQEWAYFSSIIDIYKSDPKNGITLMRNMIKAAGSTPGFGWYNIALARCMLYDGQISESKRYADKAAEFKELHIGTTLGQSQYDFSIQLIKLINKDREWYMQKFEHRNWWYNPTVLSSMTKEIGEKYLQQFLIITQFAQNPERDRVIYKLFSTESTVSWDEIYYLIHDFSTQYFVNTFKKEADNDPRKYIRKYFTLFVARLEIQQGKYKEAHTLLSQLLVDPSTDAEYEKLFTARVLQSQAECAQATKDNSTADERMYQLYRLYPQLVPYIDMQMNMVLHVSGDVDNATEERLRACNITWVTNSSIPAPEAYVIFSSKGGKKDITYYVLDKNGNYIVQKQSFAWQKPEDAAVQLAYRLFNIGGKMPEAEDDNKDTAPGGA